ncbi:MAG: LacI family DNA-binding transcriptional regulator [Lachnospiraceae bacterium]|nr:LacI family DNA-binding transcriptional regulator [Lachnospiraceae bacterium]
MAVKKVTMQDIADACGLSRNTVSKIFNNRGSVPESTRVMVLSKARELGYGQIPEEVVPVADDGVKNIALLTQHKLLTHNFGTYFITSFTDYICRSGYTIKMFEISDEEIASVTLPPFLKLDETAGILCIELFDRTYLEMVASLGLPCVFVDGFAGSRRPLLICDYISMENYSSSMALTEHLIEKGAQRIGFVGDKTHCNSFHERWLAYRDTLIDHGLPSGDAFSILEKDCENYGDPDWLAEQVSRLPSIPDAFVCANDYLAVHLMAALKKLGLKIPQDVMVTGFDGSPEAFLVEPTLTTARICSEDIGRTAGNMLIDRIHHPEHLFRDVSILSTPVWGGSTRRPDVR